jgi:hypothetical protein
MSNLESHGNGFTGRVDGPMFDGGMILAPAAMAFGSVGESVQTEVQNHPELLHDGDNGVIASLLETVGSMPLDAKAVGLGAAAASAVMIGYAGRKIRDISVENSIIAAGLDPESAVEPRGKRALKRVGATTVAAIAAYAGYKVGEPLTAMQDITADLSLIGAAAAYMTFVRKRMTGKF